MRRMLPGGVLALACTGPLPLPETPQASTDALGAHPAHLTSETFPSVLGRDTGAGSRARESGVDLEGEIDPVAQSEPVLDGVMPLSPRVLETIQPFLDLRRARLAAISSDATRMLVLSPHGDAVQAHLLRAPLAARTQITFGTNPVDRIVFAPGWGDAVIYRMDADGNELYQLYHLDLHTRQRRRLTDGTSEHGNFVAWGRSGLLTYTSNARNGRDMDVYAAPLAAGPAPARRLLALDAQSAILGWSPDARTLLVRKTLSTSTSTVLEVEVETGALRTLAPPTRGISYRSAIFHPDGRRLFVTSDREGDFVSLYEVSADLVHWQELTPRLGWDVEGVALSRDGSKLAFTTNEDGVSVLRVLDTSSGHERELRDLSSGVISGLRFSGAGQTLAFTRTTPTETPDVFTYALDRNRLVRWTSSELGGLPGDWFVRPGTVKIPSFDGVEVPALVYRPEGAGRHPTLLWVHGGPEDQSRPEFEPMVQYFVRVLRIAVVLPNVRGSNGYGKHYRSLDDGMRRFDAIRDIGAVLDWIARDPGLDPERVGIYGPSYGGFVALSSMAEYGPRLRAGCSLVGPSNLATFLGGTRRRWQASRREEYGNERDPKVRAYLESISPVTRAARMVGPVLIAHGANDPRVPVSEARHMVDAVRQQGQEAWLYIATDDGHGFRKRKNRDRFFRIMATFFERYLLHAEPTPVRRPSANAARARARDGAGYGPQVTRR